MDITTYGMDIAKSVFQLHWVDTDTGEIHRRKLTRAKVANSSPRLPGRVAMEACGGAHHWARALAALGHQVELLPAHQVRAFVSGNKDDAADARAIWLAAQHGDLRRVAVKSCQQQAELSLHRMRSHWVGMRTATVNALRSLLYEFGVALPRGKRVGCGYSPNTAPRSTRSCPRRWFGCINGPAAGPAGYRAAHPSDGSGNRSGCKSTNETAVRLRKVPGIGVLGATALAGAMGNGAAWRSAREFASCLGLTPGHSGTGGKVRMAGIYQTGRQLPANAADARGAQHHPCGQIQPPGSCNCSSDGPSTWWWPRWPTSSPASPGRSWPRAGNSRREWKINATQGAVNPSTQTAATKN